VHMIARMHVDTHSRRKESYLVQRTQLMHVGNLVVLVVQRTQLNTKSEAKSLEHLQW